MILETIMLDSGLSITLLDQTLHYFGGYYHVKVMACCDIPLKQSYFENAAEYSHAMEKLGETAMFERILEKMAVPESDIEAVRSQLTQDFYNTALAYLSVPDFAPRFVRGEYHKRVKKPTQIRSARA